MCLDLYMYAGRWVFLAFVVSYVHVRRISVFVYPSLPFLFLCSCMHVLTDMIVVLIPIVYLEVCRLSFEVSGSLYIYSYM